MGSDTRSRDGRSSTAGVHCPSGVQKSVGVESLKVFLASSLAQESTATTTRAEGSTTWFRVLVEGAVADSQVTVLIVGVAVHAPEAVLLLAPQRPLGGVEAGVGEGGPDVRAVAGHGVVEAAAAQQAEVGHPGLPGGRRVVGGPVDPAASDQVGGQAVDRLQHGQPPQGGLDAARRGGPGRVLVVGAAPAVCASCITGGEGGVTLALQVDRVVVVQGEPFPVVPGQFTLGVKGSQPRSPCLLPGRGMLMVGDVEQVHRLAGQEPAVLASFGHAPHHRRNPATAAQAAQHGPHPVLAGFHDGG